ncbi:MAG: hypothetical protein K6E91_01345, partial [Butyrivibrio sp.]|nr:hypothetical protein [Butyrivibrio sp.]
YGSMQFIIRNTDDAIRAEHEKMSGLSSMSMDGMPHAHNPKACEDRLIRGIEEIDILKERYRQAQEYMDWFQPAWDQLSEEEQYVLLSFFGDINSYGSNAAYDVMRYFEIEQTSAYKRKNRAIDHLTVLLFGKD